MRSRIRELRRAQKLSQAELADAVGTTRQTITSIEVGKYTASLPLAYKIARYFGLTIEEVFDFSEIDEELQPFDPATRRLAQHFEEQKKGARP